MMKYIVVKLSPSDLRNLVAFPGHWVHKDMVEILKARYPALEVVSAGELTNYREAFALASGSEYTFDQVRLGGRSETLRLESRPEDMDIFVRQTGP